MKFRVLLNCGPTSTQLISASAVFTLNIIRTKISHVIGQFPKFRWNNSKLSVLPENWHKWYLGGGASKSTLRFLKFWPQNTFLGKFRPKKWKFSILPENWHTYISRIIILISTLVFWISNPKSIFGQIWSIKVKVVCVTWKWTCRIW